MPDHSKYPPRFDPYHFYYSEPTVPLENLVEIDDLTSEEDSYNILLCLADIREMHPTATHIYVEKEYNDGDSNLKTTIQCHTHQPNPNYAWQMEAYQAAKATVLRAKAEWEADSRRWKAEVEEEKRAADYQTYMNLKRRFEGGA